jgi:Ion transport protein.
VINGALTLFKIITGDGWISSLYSGVDAVGKNLQPKVWHDPPNVLLFYGFLLVFNIFLKNLFVGVVIDNFQQMKEELGGYLLLTFMQRDWVEMQLFMQRKKLIRVIPEPENKIRKFCYFLAKKKGFDYSILFLIVLNTFVLGLKFTGQSDTFSLVLDIFNHAFLVIFNIEALIKIAGWGVFYFKDSWNKYLLSSFH